MSLKTRLNNELKSRKLIYAFFKRYVDLTDTVSYSGFVRNKSFCYIASVFSTHWLNRGPGWSTSWTLLTNRWRLLSRVTFESYNISRENWCNLAILTVFIKKYKKYYCSLQRKFLLIYRRWNGELVEKDSKNTQNATRTSLHLYHHSHSCNKFVFF